MMQSMPDWNEILDKLKDIVRQEPNTLVTHNRWMHSYSMGGASCVCFCPYNTARVHMSLPVITNYQNGEHLTLEADAVIGLYDKLIQSRYSTPYPDLLSLRDVLPDFESAVYRVVQGTSVPEDEREISEI